MNAEEALRSVLAPYREAARRRVERGTSGPLVQIEIVDYGIFVTHEPVEDVDGIPAHMERRAEPLGEWSDSNHE